MKFLNNYLERRRQRLQRFEEYDTKTLQEKVREYELYHCGTLVTRFWDRLHVKVPRRRNYRLAKKILEGRKNE